MNRNTVLLLAVFAVGCAAGMHLDSRAQAQTFTPPTKVRKWQQFCTAREPAWGAEEMQKRMNARLKELGEQGWELAAVYEAEYCFKRPVD